jgi:sorting nexin-13
MDEVFDLRNRNQWLRRRIFYMLREILRAMYGDVFNQRIVDSVEALTSADHVAEYIRTIK